MPIAVGYEPQHQRPPFRADGLVVARRPGLRFSRPEPYAIGEVLPASEMDANLVARLWKTYYADTLLAGTPTALTEAEMRAAAKPGGQKAAPPRGR